MQTFGRDPKWLGGELGITMVLHTWSQTLEPPLHVHCIVTGGAWDADANQWSATKRRDFLFPVRALSKVFRAKYTAGLHDAFTPSASSLGAPPPRWPRRAPLSRGSTGCTHTTGSSMPSRRLPASGRSSPTWAALRTGWRSVMSGFVALKDHQGLFSVARQPAWRAGEDHGLSRPRLLPALPAPCAARRLRSGFAITGSWAIGTGPRVSAAVGPSSRWRGQPSSPLNPPQHS